MRLVVLLAGFFRARGLALRLAGVVDATATDGGETGVADAANRAAGDADARRAEDGVAEGVEDTADTETAGVEGRTTGAADAEGVEGAVDGTDGLEARFGLQALDVGGKLGAVRVAACQSGTEASLREPARSGRRSISEAMTAYSVLICWLVVIEERQSHQLLWVLDSVVWTTSRWPMSLEANSEVPPCSLAEQRRMYVLPQFSTMVSATPFP